LTRIWSETKVDPLKWPTAMTGIPGWKSCGGLVVF
jgi:hypothetical protein